MDSIEISEGVRITNDRCLLLDGGSVAVLGDLHLGYEKAMEEEGLYLPRINTGSIRDALNRILSKYEPSTVVLLGDIKHDFRRSKFEARNEVRTVIGLLDDAAELGLISLLVIALMKVLVTAMCLSLGWSGGYIFPSFFMGAALGLAIHQALPFIPEIVCLVCVMAGVSVALMKSPIALALIVQTLFDVRLAPVIAISILAAFLLTYRHDLVSVGRGDRAETDTALP